MTRRRYLCAVLALLGGCEVRRVPPPPASSGNHCNDDASCGGGAVCVEKLCARAQGFIDDLVFVVDGHVQTESELTGRELDLVLAPDVRVQVHADATGCDATAALTFRRATRPGLDAGKTYSVVHGSGDADAFVDLPTGYYDVYAEPTPVSGATPCMDSPRAWAGMRVDSSNHMVDLRGHPARVPFRLVNAGRDLQGWTLEIVEPLRGQPLSKASVIDGEPLKKCAEGESCFDGTLSYAPIDARPVPGLCDVAGRLLKQQTELIRLTPPEALRGEWPSLVWPLWMFAPSPTEPALLDGSLLGQSSEVVGTVRRPMRSSGETCVREAAGYWEPTQYVTVVRRRSNDDTAYVWFMSAVSTRGDQGEFSVHLPPGEYTLHGSATPPGQMSPGSYGVGVAAWKQPALPGAVEGPTICLEKRVEPTGRVSLPAMSGERAASETLAAQQVRLTTLRFPDSAVVAPVLRAALDAEFFPWPGVSAGVGAGGDFKLSGERYGRFSVSVRPHPSTGYPWQVWPMVALDAAEPFQKSLELPLPVLHRGILRRSVGSSGSRLTPVSKAQIRVYAYVTADGGLWTKQAGEAPRCGFGLVPIAETWSGDDGRFSFLLPSAPGGG